MLAALANMAQGTFASKVVIAGDKINVTREIDGGLQTVSLNLPAVATALGLVVEVPAALARPTLEAAGASAGTAWSAAVSARVVALAREGMRAMLVTRTGPFAALLLFTLGWREAAIVALAASEDDRRAFFDRDWGLGRASAT